MDTALINKFLNNQCLPEEAEDVAGFLLAHPDQLDKFLPIGEWNLKEEVLVLSYDNKLALKQKIDTVISQPRKLFFVKYLRYMVAAACVIMAIFIANFLFHYQQVSLPSITAYKVDYIENLSDKPIDTILPDGANAQLQPGSRLSFKENFSLTKRVQVETGKILFEEHGQTKPLIVIAQGIAVTPLGTKFIVNNRKEKKVVEVELIEGSVKIESIDSSVSLAPVVLNPNQQLRIDLQTLKYTRTAIYPEVKSNQKVKSRAGSKAPDAIWSNQEMRFNQTALPIVLDKIAFQYKVYIAHDRKALSDHRFTGDIYYNDAIETLMEHICQVNNLDYHMKGDTIYLEKRSSTK